MYTHQIDLVITYIRKKYTKKKHEYAIKCDFLIILKPCTQ